jgi:hypothetical protein
MGALFLRLHARHQKPGFPIPEFFRSHPAGLDRHRAIMDQYDKLQAERPNPDPHVGTDDLRRRIVWPRENP